MLGITKRWFLFLSKIYFLFLLKIQILHFHELVLEKRKIIISGFSGRKKNYNLLFSLPELFCHTLQIFASVDLLITSSVHEIYRQYKCSMPITLNMGRIFMFDFELYRRPWSCKCYSWLISRSPCYPRIREPASLFLRNRSQRVQLSEPWLKWTVTFFWLSL